MKMLSNNLLLLSVFLLVLCGRVDGERLQSPQRRRTAIGGRATMAPTLSPDDGMGKGSKSEKSDKSLTGKGKGKGKGSKSEKFSSKSEKKFGKNLGVALGKTSKDRKEPKFAKSGGATIGTSKSEKSKSEKSIKQPKSGKATPPTPGASISSKSSVFAITYSPTNGIPTSKDLEELAKMTEEYLEEFMFDFFDKTALTDLDDFETVMLQDFFVAGEPVIVEYQSNGLFDPDSIFIPVTRELDNLIEDAIAQDAYEEMLKDLKKSNPFHGAEIIAFTEADSDAPTAGESTSGSESSSFVRAGVAAAAAGMVVLAAGLAVLKRRRPSFDDDDTFSPQKSTTEDVTFTGDNSSMGVEDVSSHFAHWRRGKSYSNELEGGEFQDEPLDR